MSAKPSEKDAPAQEPVAKVSLRQFLLDTPLYDEIPFSSLSEPLALALKGRVRIDGHCPFCRRSTTFWSGPTISDSASNQLWDGVFTAKLTCARVHTHEILIYLQVAEAMVEKIGQYPSLADIVNDAAKKYSKILNRQDEREFHRAIGLAAHGVGIGAFV